MPDKRKLKRRHLIYYLRVTERGTGALVGFLVNITPQGIMIMSEEPIPEGKTFELQLLVPGETTQRRYLQFKARSLWCKKSVNTDFYDSGFELQNINVNEFSEIENIIHELGFND